VANKSLKYIYKDPNKVLNMLLFLRIKNNSSNSIQDNRLLSVDEFPQGNSSIDLGLSVTYLSIMEKTDRHTHK